jgi:hypothetical protein
MTVRKSEKTGWCKRRNGAAIGGGRRSRTRRPEAAPVSVSLTLSRLTKLMPLTFAARHSREAWKGARARSRASSSGRR